MRKIIAVILGIFLINVNSYPVLSGEWTAHGFIYKPSLGARGETEKKIYDSGLNRVDERLKKEIWVGDPVYGDTLQTAIAAIGSNNVILRLPAGTHTIAADLTIPANITFKPERGAILSVATAKTLTINGGIEAGFYQIFSCTGTGAVAFGDTITKVYPQWWGAKGDGSTDDAAAIQAAIDAINPGMAVVLPVTSDYYKILSTITIGKGIGFYGEGSISYYPAGQGVRIRNENTAGADAILMDSSYPGHGSNLRDFILEGNPLSGHGIRINNHQGSTFTNIFIGRRGFSDARFDYGHGKSGLYLDTLSYYNRFTNVRVHACQENGFLLLGGIASGINANTFINCQADDNKMNGFLLDSYCSSNNFYSCIAEGNGLYGLLHGSSTASLGLQNNSFYDFYNEGNGLTGSDGIVINAGLRTKLIGGGYSSGTLWINAGAGARIESPSAATIIIGADASYTMLTNIFYSATLTDGGRYTTVIDSVMNKGIYSSGYYGETRFKVAENGLELGTGNQYSFMPLKWYGMQIFPSGSLSVGDLPMPYPPYNIQRGDRTFTRLASAGAPSEAVCVQRLDTTIGTQADGPTTTIVVASTTGMAVNDNISVLLTDGTWANNCIDTVTNPTTLVLKWAGIPTGKHAAVGAAVRTCRWKTGAALAN